MIAPPIPKSARRCSRPGCGKSPKSHRAAAALPSSRRGWPLTDRFATPVVLLLMLSCSTLLGQDAAVLPVNGIKLGQTQKQRWKVGVTVTATAPCQGITANFPVPTDWPEQTVQIVEEEISPQVSRVRTKTLEGGVKQMHVAIPTLRAGESAVALVTFEVTKAAILGPSNTAEFVVPKAPPRTIKRYLGTSPYIEVRHSQIRSRAKTFRSNEQGGWETVESIYDWVRDNVEYRNGKLKGALAALRDGNGDCEELTSLFIALCRNNGIPARTVWIPGHCYPEFYLDDANGVGHWFPCQAAGSREFGAMEDFKPILQKGDNFKVPDKKERQRYVAEFLKAKKTTRPPKVRFTRELLRD